MRLLPYGDRAVLLELDDPLSVAPALRGAPGVVEVVPGARTVLVRFDPASTTPDALAAAARGTSRRRVRGGALVEIPIRYDGADLDAVAAESGLDRAEVVARHCGGEYRVAFCGFSPGFAYLTGLDPALQLPRLAEPRTRVPAGAVGVAGEFTGIYPRPSPGGWRLLGHTDAPLWRAERDPPALLVPG
ncbi:MAG: allophanate hydrolase subunit 1, partial [Jatrophihabitans sp.]